MRRPDYWPQATRDLAERDAVLRGLIERFRGVALASRGDAFTTLARSIVGQQISVKAAQSVWERLSGRLSPVTPASVYRVRASTLKACGLSGQKASYLRDLSGKFLDGSLEAARWYALDDETLIGELTQVKGIGRWTAEMFLMFHLRRPDVLPVNDVGINRAIQKQYGLVAPPKPDEVRSVGQAWRPWATVACWYLWRSEDVVLPQSGDS